MKNPVLTRPIQMFAIEFSAAFLMVLLVPGDKGTAIITTPLIAGAAAAVAGLGIGAYEKALLAKEYGPAGPVLAGTKTRPKKKKEKQAQEGEPQPRPAMRAIGVSSTSTSQESPVSAGTAAGSQSVVQEQAQAVKAPAASAQPQYTPQAPAPAPAISQQPSTSLEQAKLPAWMEKAMAQARMSQEQAAVGDAEPSTKELTQEELRARLEQPVNLGMPVKASPPSPEPTRGVESIDELVGGAASRSQAPSQIDSPISESFSAQGMTSPKSAARSIQAAVIHPDPDHRHHISSMLSWVGVWIAFEADSEEGALLGLLDTNVDVIVTALAELSKDPAEYVAKLRKASQFGVIVGYSNQRFQSIRGVATFWDPGGPIPSELSKMLGI